MAVAGIDIGSLTAEVVIMEQDKMISYVIRPTGFNSKQAAEKAIKEALMKAGLNMADLSSIVATGYGRISIDFADKIVTEITCHGRGAFFWDPTIRTVIDIGGQDSKVISLDRGGRVIDFAMNDKCAAGTGRFLEVMAQALELKLNELGPVSLKHKKSVVISSMCTVFAESEVVSLIAEGCAKEDILNGLHQAIASRVSAMAQSLRVEKVVALCGGVAKNVGVVKALEQNLRVKVKVPAEPQIIAALGAAICAREMVV